MQGLREQSLIVFISNNSGVSRGGPSRARPYLTFSVPGPARPRPARPRHMPSLAWPDPLPTFANVA